MLLYTSIFLIPLLFYVFGNNNPEIESSCSFLAIILLFLALFIGFGDMIGGYDRYIYGEMFDVTAQALRKDWPWRSYGNEYGYSVFMWLIAHITANRYIFILITTFVIYFLFYKAFVKYLDKYPIACIVFMGMLYYYSMTYLRQILAVGFVLQSCRYAYERKPVPFFLWLALAFSFHNSAILFAVMYFIPNKQYSNRTILWFLFAMLLLGFTPISSFLFNSFGDATNTEVRTDAYTDTMDWGPQKAIVSAIFLIILLLNRDLEKDDTKSIFFFNMAIMYCAVELVFVRFMQGGRLGWFFMFGLIYTYSIMADNVKRGSWFRTIIIAMSFIMFFRITYSWRTMNVPYKTFLTNGYPPGGMVMYSEHEYDSQYVENKFYKPAFDWCSNMHFKMVKMYDDIQ